MSMSSHVVGFRPPDETFDKMFVVWNTCQEAGVTVPKEVQEFFGWESPDENGIVVDIKEAVTPYNADYQDGFEVDITKLPKDVKIIRFYNSY